LVSWQLFLALWPGMIFMASNAQSRIVAALSRVMPHRTAFVAATCLRFLPMLLSEVQQIRAIQTLRGARLLLGDLKYPRYWPDWIHCLLIPALIKTLSLASDISTAATARDFGIQPKRTAWPGE
jgi:energy-coupling factor transport system permease protein